MNRTKEVQLRSWCEICRVVRQRESGADCFGTLRETRLLCLNNCDVIDFEVSIPLQGRINNGCLAWEWQGLTKPITVQSTDFPFVSDMGEMVINSLNANRWEGFERKTLCKIAFFPNS